MEQYNLEIGKYYDIAFFITTSLFEDEMIKRVFRRNDDSLDVENDMQYYFQMKKLYPVIPDCLIPFCYCDYDDEVGSFLIILSTYINFGYDKYEDFIYLLQNKENNKSLFIKHYFPGIDNDEFTVLYNSNDAVSMNEIISKSNIKDKYKRYFLAALVSYDKVIDILMNTCAEVYPLMNKVYENNHTVFEKIIVDIHDKTKKLPEKLYGYYALTEDRKNIYTFSLLNPYLYWFCYDFFPYYGFRLGIRGDERLQISEFNLVTPRSFSKLVSNDTKYDIYEMFLKYTCLCIADIAHCLNISKSTAYGHLNKMVYDKLIIIKEEKNQMFYYALNETYICKLVESLRYNYQCHLEIKRKEEPVLYDLPERKKTMSTENLD